MEVLTAQELAGKLKVSVAAIRKWTRQGMPSLPVGSLRRYRLEEVVEWLREKEENKRLKEKVLSCA